MSGYADVDLPGHDGQDWAALEDAVVQVLALAGQLGVWVAMGSAHRLGAGHKPHNSLYLITPDGELAGPQ